MYLSLQVSFVKEQKKVSGENIVPAVIEPSFGIGRLIYALLEQSFWVRSPGKKGIFVSCFVVLFIDFLFF